MPQKHLFIDPEDKAALLSRIDDNIDVLPAAKRSNIYPKSARRIITRSQEIQVYYDTHDLPPPTLRQRVATNIKLTRKHVLSKIEGNRLKDGIKQDRHYREMGQYEVAQKLGIKGSISTVRREMKALNVNRVKPTKKLALTDIQKAQRYEIALSRKDWTLDN